MRDIENLVNEVQEDSTDLSSLLELVNTTEIVELPSRGVFYSHPLLKEGKIEIKQMTTNHEDILSNQSYIKDGTVLERLVKALVVDKSIDCTELLSGDFTAILNAARVSAYGPEYEAHLVCPACNNKEEVIISLKNAAPYFETESILGDAKIVNDKVHVQLDFGSNKVLFVLKMMTLGTEKEIIKRKDARNTANIKKKLKLKEFGLADEMSMVVESINGETNPSVISQFIQNMPAAKSKELRRLYKEMQPKISNIHECTCSVCKTEIQEEVGINPNFFWPKD